MKRTKRYRRILEVALCITLIMAGYLLFRELQNRIPSNIKIIVNQKHEFNFSLPVQADMNKEAQNVMNIENAKLQGNQIKFNLDKPFTIQSSKKGNYKISLKLFGLFEFKTVKLDVIDDIKLVPCGMPIGIYVKTDGLLVLGTGVIHGQDGLNYEPALNILKTGDYIWKVNSTKIDSIEEMQKIIQQNKGKEVVLTIRREEEDIEMQVDPVIAMDGEYKIGAWIRQDTQGIGTMTYVDKNGIFGALGHGITDADTNLLLVIKEGGVYQAEIMRVLKGKKGKPGELVGLIDLEDQNKIGNIISNCSKGIFGEIQNNIVTYEEDNALPIALKQEIKIGGATIRCQVDDKVKEYDIEIIDINNDSKNKGMVLKITDPDLIKITGGIVQGMSGSPIIQNGKLVGAITHVLVQDSTKGYGTFIENMIQNVE